jgi:hypothetical protein
VKFTTTPRLLEFLNSVHELRGLCEVMSGLPESNAFAGFSGVDGNSRSEGLKLRLMNYRSKFDLFLHVLAVDVQFAGGRFTIEKNIASGTMIPALTLLRDEAPPGLLPVGLIPAKLSASTLQRRKTDWAKYDQRPTGTSTRSRGASEGASPATEARLGVYAQRKKRKG